MSFASNSNQSFGETVGKTVGKTIETLDLQSDVCPYTFVKSKMAVEQLESGQEIIIVLGNSESASNVPRSLDGEGHEIVNIEKVGKSLWQVRVKKQ
jgi:tRNA 2-thiouridine synthesizing protein A